MYPTLPADVSFANPALRAFILSPSISIDLLFAIASRMYAGVIFEELGESLFIAPLLNDVDPMLTLLVPSSPIVS